MAPGSSRPPSGAKQPVDLAISIWKERRQAVQTSHRAVGLQLDDMQGQLVGPGQRAPFHFVHLFAGRRLQHSVGDRQHIQIVVSYDHIFQFDAEGLEQMVSAAVTHRSYPMLLLSIRRRKTRMILR